MTDQHTPYTSTSADGMMRAGYPAFPVWELNGNGQPEMTGFGMTLRDYFAAKALPAMYRVFWGDIRAFGATVPEDWEMGIARDAYKLADAMLKAREGER